MNTLEQIKQAEKAFIICLNPESNSINTRYAIYTQNKNDTELNVIWCLEIDYENHKKDRLLPYQVYFKSSKWKYPAYHFVVNGYGFNKQLELKTMLQKINKNIKVYNFVPGYAIHEI